MQVGGLQVTWTDWLWKEEGHPCCTQWERREDGFPFSANAAPRPPGEWRLDTVVPGDGE